MNIRQVPTTWGNAAEHLRKLAEAINSLIITTQIRGDVTFATSPAIISDDRIGEDSVLVLMPKDGSAQAATYHAVVNNGEITINHTGTGVFKYLVILYSMRGSILSCRNIASSFSKHSWAEI